MYRYRLVSIMLLSFLPLSAQAQPAYPSIDKATQAARDSDRLHILRAELQAERETLAKAQAALDRAQDDAHRAEVHRRLENIKALQRELGLVPRAPSARLAVKPRPARVPVVADSNRVPHWDTYRHQADGGGWDD